MFAIYRARCKLKKINLLSSTRNVGLVPKWMSPKQKKTVTKAYLERKEKQRAKRLFKFKGTPILIREHLSAKGIANLLGVRTIDVLKILIALDVAPESSDDLLPTELVDIICSEFGRVPVRGIEGEDVYPRPKPTEQDKFPKRPATVVIMGHVNHGKTTLLDTLRKSREKLTDQEAGGITQRMSAFSVPVKSETITFLDTPGHAAFQQMRERGANLADIGILVVDADRGVQEQTVSSAQALKQAEIPIIVALNKCDKSSARPKRCKEQLANIGLIPEDSGGTVPTAKISALTGDGIEDLKELLLTQAGVMDLKADRSGNAEFVVLESRIHPHYGVLCSIIVQIGTLKINDWFVAGIRAGKVRWIFQDDKQVKEGLPGYPLEISGIKDRDQAPKPGDYGIVVPEKKAAAVAEFRKELSTFHENLDTQLDKDELRKQQLEQERADRAYAISQGLNDDEYVRKVNAERESKVKQVPLMLKVDIGGSIEAVQNFIDSLPTDELNVQVVRTGIGDVNDNDVRIAATGTPKAHIIAFNVSTPESVRALAAASEIHIVYFNVIYKVFDWIKSFCSKLLPPTISFNDLATCQVKQIFEMTVRGEDVRIAGCTVLKGVVKRGATVQVRKLTTGETIYTGKIRQLRHLKEDVKSVSSGMECGIMLADDFQAFSVGDYIVAVEEILKYRNFAP